MPSFYDVIKESAREGGIRISDLLALAPANDPFYTGRPSEIEAAEWFANLWKAFGYGRGVHLRRIHYQIVSQSPAVEMPNCKSVYENTQRCWDYLNNAAKWARYHRFVVASGSVTPSGAICEPRWALSKPWCGSVSAMTRPNG